MSETGNEMGVPPSGGEPDESTVEPIEPTEANPPPGETPPPDAESPRARRLSRAAGFAARLIRGGATRRGARIADEAERLGRAEDSEVAAEEAEDSTPHEEGEEGSSADDTEATASPAREPAEAEFGLFAPLDQYLDRTIHEESIKRETKDLLAMDQEELLNKYLSTLGVGVSESAQVAELMKSSNVRLIMKGLRDLGLPESQADEAHRIIMTEKGDIKIEHIVGLGFSAEEAEAVYELLNSSKAHHIKQELEKLGLQEDIIDQIIYTGDDEERLVGESLSKLGLEDHVVDRILKFRQSAKEDEARKQDLGYDDKTKAALAYGLGITDEILDKAEKKRVPIDLLIAAEQNGDIGLSEWLSSNGIELPSHIGTEGKSEEKWNRRKRRQNTRSKARVETVYPYPVGHPLYGMGHSNYPHLITRSETEYYRNMMRQRPSWLRNSLIRPGSLPLPKVLYHNRLSRPFLDAANMVWAPLVGRRRLAGKLLKFEKRRHPDEDYGPTGWGREKRHHMLDHVKKVDETITTDRSLLSWHRRHRNRGAIRRNPRLDLAQSIAEVKRDLLAFEMGRPELPSEEEYTYWRLLELPERNEEQEKLLEEIRETHPEFDY